MNCRTSSGLKGEVRVPGDKSISHRGIMLGSIAKGVSEIHNFLQGADCLSTISCFRSMGIEIENRGELVFVHGNGLRGLTRPDQILDCGNSGTTTRLISGILSGQSFDVTLTGDASIQKRPMKRIIDPLSMMGARLESLAGNGCVPLKITGSPLHGIHYRCPVASAQVKSAILLAGLYAEGETSVIEPACSRNHSEIMLSCFGAKLQAENTTVTIQPARELYANKITVPGDISSAAYFIAAGLLVPGSELLLTHVGINPTRDGILRVCRAMGGTVTLINETNEFGEPAADLLISSSSLHGTIIEGSMIPSLIDEIPIIAVMACFAEGETVIKDAQELKVKESNRIDTVVHNLSSMGADITATDDGMIIRGGHPLHGAVIDSHMDHRIAMAFAIASLMADGDTVISGAECVNISYPEFYKDLERLSR